MYRGHQVKPLKTQTRRHRAPIHPHFYPAPNPRPSPPPPPRPTPMGVHRSRVNFPAEPLPFPGSVGCYRVTPRGLLSAHRTTLRFPFQMGGEIGPWRPGPLQTPRALRPLPQLLPDGAALMWARVSLVSRSPARPGPGVRMRALFRSLWARSLKPFLWAPVAA